ncbi:MAG: HIT domain-containing protein [Deltaproteobacteria bacterium]|nr:HIT domain-containing protein [Deltaproteobacteria bacterium]
MTQILWAPWRMEFISKAHKKVRGCIFCSLPKKGNPRKNLVLHRGKKAFVLLNRYPYTNGHLLISPFRHFNLFEEITAEEHREMGELVARSIAALKRSVHPQGFNVGLNLGKAAGAGIEGHLHYHVVPRWVGDSNFMPIIGGTRSMPEYIDETYVKLKKYF